MASTLKIPAPPIEIVVKTTRTRTRALNQVAADEDRNVQFGARFPRFNGGRGASVVRREDRMLHAGLSGSCGPDVASLRRPPAAGTVTSRADDRTLWRGRIFLRRENRLHLRLKVALELFSYPHSSLRGVVAGER